MTHYAIPAIVAVFCIIISIVALRAWAEAEMSLHWFASRYFSEPRLPGKHPKIGRFRKFLFFVFNLKYPYPC